MAANFCFNFEISEDCQDSLSKQQNVEHEEVNESSKKTAEFVYPSEEQLNVVFDSNLVTQCFQLPGFADQNTVCLRHLSVKYVERLVRNLPEFSSSAIKLALNSNTDLIPSLYEGGMKIWECSRDLVEFLHKTLTEKELSMAGKRVLELGCGAGLPGIYAMLNGATVHFQDYNDEVLRLFTIPNVALSLQSSGKLSAVSMKQTLKAVQKTCQFSSGDWGCTLSLLEPASYDIILTSETIYNISIQQLLYELIKNSLKPNGVVFVAAKSYYFGVGGGTDQFMNFVRKDGMFDISAVATYNNGVKREILKMQMFS